MYGKILKITKAGNDILYTYDAAGNRISKTVGGITTWYVRDASGNVMSIYEKGRGDLNGGELTQSEVHLYGSSRLGIVNTKRNVEHPFVAVNGINTFERGNKFFELSNHLGNVLATITDRKLGVDENSDGVVDYYTADVASAQDYYSFGMMMPGHTYSATSVYRYGFNGKEKDKDINLGSQDYGLRIYDSRIGKFLSVDPLTQSYPWYTPYQFAGNTPIQAIDLDGGEPTYPQTIQEVFGKPVLQVPVFDFVFQKTRQTFAFSNVLNMLAFHKLNSEKNAAPGWPSVQTNEHKQGYYNCINSQTSAVRILYNDFKLPALPGMPELLNFMAKKGLASEEYKFNIYTTKDGVKKKVDEVNFLDSKPDAIDDVGTKFSEMAKENGLHVFGIALMNGFHSVLVTVQRNEDNITFVISEQTGLTKGATEPLNKDQFNAKLLQMMGAEFVTDPKTGKWILPVDSNADGRPDFKENGEVKVGATTSQARKLLNEK